MLTHPSCPPHLRLLDLVHDIGRPSHEQLAELGIDISRERLRRLALQKLGLGDGEERERRAVKKSQPLVTLAFAQDSQDERLRRLVADLRLGLHLASL